MGQVWLGQEGSGFRLDLVGIDQSSDLYGHDVLKFRVGFARMDQGSGQDYQGLQMV